MLNLVRPSRRAPLDPEIRRRQANLKTHFTGANPVAPGSQGAAIANRAATWSAEIRPVGTYQTWLVGQIAASTIRLDHCQQHEGALRELDAGRAVMRWDDDRRDDVEDLAAGLRKHPAQTSRKLARTTQGCDWLSCRWEALGRILDVGGDWDEAQESLALDLLGTPQELRKGPTATSPTPEGDHRPARLALVASEIERLHSLQDDSLDELDARERAAAEVGLGSAMSRPLVQLMRHEAAASRRLAWCWSQLRQVRKEGVGRADSSDPALETPPPPPPVEDEVAEDELPPEHPEAPMPPPALPIAPVAAPARAGNRRSRRYQRKMARKA